MGDGAVKKIRSIERQLQVMKRNMLIFYALVLIPTGWFSFYLASFFDGFSCLFSCPSEYVSLVWRIGNLFGFSYIWGAPLYGALLGCVVARAAYRKKRKKLLKSLQDL